MTDDHLNAFEDIGLLLKGGSAVIVLCIVVANYRSLSREQQQKVTFVLSGLLLNLIVFST